MKYFESFDSCGRTNFTSPEKLRLSGSKPGVLHGLAGMHKALQDGKPLFSCSISFTNAYL